MTNESGIKGPSRISLIVFFRCRRDQYDNKPSNGTATGRVPVTFFASGCFLEQEGEQDESDLRGKEIICADESPRELAMGSKNTKKGQKDNFGTT